MDSNKKKVSGIIQWIRKSVPSGNGLLVPVSGGSDSTLAFWLCSQALLKRTVGVYAGNNPRAKSWFKSIGEIRSLKIPKSSQNPEIMRWAYCLELSLKEKRILVGTRNKTEDVLGTYSLASRVAWFFPIVGLWKTEVLELCRYVGVPEEIIASSSRPDPMCGRPKELAEIPVAAIDIFTKVMAGAMPKRALKALTDLQVQYLGRLYGENNFKQKLPVRLTLK